MTHQGPTTGSGIVMAVARWFDRRVKTGDVFILAALIALAPLFFTNNYLLAPRLLNQIFFPVAVLLWLSFHLDWRNWPMVQFRASARIFFVFSIILTAAFVYLLAMNVSSWRQPGAIMREVDKQWAYAGYILLFMICFAFAIRTWREFLPRFVTAFATMVAASALYNMVIYLSGLNLSGGVAFASEGVRLVNSLGMPGYTNSTNISVTYAVLFIASAAVVVDSRLPRLMRFWMIPVALILLCGVVLTQARSAYVSVIVGLMIVLWTAPHAFRRAALISFVAGLVLGGLMLALLPYTRAVMETRGTSHRPEIWTTYAGNALQKPLLGYGGLSNIDIKLKDGTIIDQPHNLILSAQIRGGIFCALAMIALLAGSLYWAARFLTLRGEVIPLAMIATVATAGMFDYNLLITAVTWPWVTFWLPFSICAGAELVVRQCSQPPA